MGCNVAMHLCLCSDAQSNLIKLNGTLTSGGDVFSLQISGDGTTVVYTADQGQDNVAGL